MEAGREQELTLGTAPERPNFRLDYATPVEWVGLVERDPLTLLSDHAHCELKAAASAQTLIARNPWHPGLVRRVGPIAVEEMEHFVLVHGELTRRGGELLPIQPNPYAEALHRAADGRNEGALLDRLLVASLIEGRSLERFWLLAHHLRDRELAGLFAELLASEAVHQGQFLTIARELFPRNVVQARIEELTRREGRIVAGLSFGVRVHSGVADVEI